jgi:hypothetical protein
MFLSTNFSCLPFPFSFLAFAFFLEPDQEASKNIQMYPSQKLDFTTSILRLQFARSYASLHESKQFDDGFAISWHDECFELLLA